MNVVADAKAVSPTQLQVTLSKPSNDWLFRMTTRIGAMMDPKGVGDLATKPVGTGPYLFDTWNRGDSITLSPNPDLLGASIPVLDRRPEVLQGRHRPQQRAADRHHQRHRDGAGAGVARPVHGEQQYQVIEGTTNGEVVLSFNNAKAPLTNVKLRQAIRTAIDHKALMNTCWAGKGTLIGSMVPPTDPWYEDRTGDFPYDQAKAKQLLAESGTATPTLRLRVPNLPYAVACGQVVKSQLEQVGITVNLDQLEFPAAWLQTVFGDHDYDMSIVAHVEPRDLPAVFGNPQYYTQYNNPQLRRTSLAAEPATDEQVTNMKKAAQELSAGRGRRLPVPPAQPDRRGQERDRAAEERDHRVVRPVGAREGVSAPGRDREADA